MQCCNVSDGFTWHKSSTIAINFFFFWTNSLNFFYQILSIYFIILWCSYKAMWSLFYMYFCVFETFLLDPHWAEGTARQLLVLLPLHAGLGTMGSWFSTWVLHTQVLTHPELPSSSRSLCLVPVLQGLGWRHFTAQPQLLGCGGQFDSGLLLTQRQSGNQRWRSWHSAGSFPWAFTSRASL